MRTTCALLIAFALPLNAAPVPKEVRAGDAARLLGEWHLTEAKYGEADYAAIGTKWTFGADGKALRDRPNEGLGTAAYKIDPSAAAKTFDWETGEGTLFHGVYELDGDAFKVVLVLGTEERPAACRPIEGGYHFTFRRAK